LSINLVISAIVVALIANRTIHQFKNYSINAHELISQISTLVRAGNIDRAIAQTKGLDLPLYRIVRAGLTNANKGEDKIESEMSTVYDELKPVIDKHVAELFALANIATLTGLLGTVFGLIHTFAAISKPGLSAAEKQSLLSNGIAEAMYNTAFGLGIAVICMTAFMLLSFNAKKIKHELEAAKERLFTLLTLDRQQS
jgi:biopolymer transport protein ExbB/TolQ